MNRSGLGKLTKPKGAPGLPLGLVQLLAVNVALQLVMIGHSTALLRRGVGDTLRRVVTGIAQPLVVDLIALAVLGSLALLLTRVPRGPDDDGTRWDRLLEAGAPWWLGYALMALVLRALFVVAQHPLGAPLEALMGQVFAYLPTGRALSQLQGWEPLQWYSALALVVASGLAGGLWGRHSLQRLQRLRRSLWLGVVVVVVVSSPAAWRMHHSWRPAIAGDELASQLRATPLVDGGIWRPQGLHGRITLVEFWTTWCGACKRVLPGLRKLAQAQVDPRFELLLVNTEGRGRRSPELLEKIRRYKMDRAPELRVLLDSGSWRAAVGLTGYPTLALIGSKGRLLRLWTGTPPKGALAEAVRTALLVDTGL